MICGVDEAGRGPVLGPMVIAGLKCRQEDTKILKGMGVKDSKDLSPKRREELFEKLTASYETHVVIVPPDEIYRWVLGKKGLNRLEAAVFGDIGIVEQRPQLRRLARVPKPRIPFAHHAVSEPETRSGELYWNMNPMY